MNRLGTLDRLSQGMGIVLLDDQESVPAIGATVVDETLEEIGTVVDVIGPVDAPLAVVAPAESANLVDHLGDRLYRRNGSR